MPAYLFPPEQKQACLVLHGLGRVAHPKDAESRLQDLLFGREVQEALKASFFRKEKRALAHDLDQFLRDDAPPSKKLLDGVQAASFLLRPLLSRPLTKIRIEAIDEVAHLQIQIEEVSKYLSRLRLVDDGRPYRALAQKVAASRDPMYQSARLHDAIQDQLASLDYIVFYMGDILINAFTYFQCERPNEALEKIGRLNRMFEVISNEVVERENPAYLAALNVLARHAFLEGLSEDETNVFLFGEANLVLDSLPRPMRLALNGIEFAPTPNFAAMKRRITALANTRSPIWPQEYYALTCPNQTFRLTVENQTTHLQEAAISAPAGLSIILGGGDSSEVRDIAAWRYHRGAVRLYDMSVVSCERVNTLNERLKDTALKMAPLSAIQEDVVDSCWKENPIAFAHVSRVLEFLAPVPRASLLANLRDSLVAGGVLFFRVDLREGTGYETVFGNKSNLLLDPGLYLIQTNGDDPLAIKEFFQRGQLEWELFKIGIAPGDAWDVITFTPSTEQGGFTYSETIAIKRT